MAYTRWRKACTQKKSLNKKRLTTDPAFANIRKSSAVFGIVSTIAKEAYWALPKEKSKHGMIVKLTGMANEIACKKNFKRGNRS